MLLAVLLRSGSDLFDWQYDIWKKKTPASNINPSTSYIIHPFTPTHSLHCLDNVYKHLYEEIYKRKRRKEEKGSEASLEHDKSIRKGLDREER